MKEKRNMKFMNFMICCVIMVSSIQPIYGQSDIDESNDDNTLILFMQRMHSCRVFLPYSLKKVAITLSLILM